MSRLNEGMFTSDRPDWATPQAFFDLVDTEFGFTLEGGLCSGAARRAQTPPSRQLSSSSDPETTRPP